MSVDIKARAVREYGLLAGVSERTETEERWAQRLYGLLVGMGEDVWRPVAWHRVGSSSPNTRDHELDVRLTGLFAVILKETSRDE